MLLRVILKTEVNFNCLQSLGNKLVGFYIVCPSETITQWELQGKLKPSADMFDREEASWVVYSVLFREDHTMGTSRKVVTICRHVLYLGYSYDFSNVLLTVSFSKTFVE